MGPTTSSAQHVEHVYVVERQAPGAPRVEIAQLPAAGSIQRNPAMVQSSDWRFFIAPDGTFRAEQRINETSGDPPKMTFSAMLFRFNGTELVPVP